MGRIVLKEKVFTLIELMIVVAIIAVLAAIAILNFMSFVAKTQAFGGQVQPGGHSQGRNFLVFGI